MEEKESRAALVLSSMAAPSLALVQTRASRVGGSAASALQSARLTVTGDVIVWISAVAAGCRLRNSS
jgi:hypothetical protein